MNLRYGINEPKLDVSDMLKPSSKWYLVSLSSNTVDSFDTKQNLLNYVVANNISNYYVFQGERFVIQATHDLVPVAEEVGE